MAHGSKDQFSYFLRIEATPIPPVRENMELFAAGDIAIGVEFRVLTDALLTKLGLAENAAANGLTNLNDLGVSFHVYARTTEGNYERLRFDCFKDLPHYHYFSMTKKVQDTVYLDRTATGDTVAWALDIMSRRLVQMLERADVENAAALVDVVALERIMPHVAECAYRARFMSDPQQLKQIEERAAAAGPQRFETGAERSWAEHSHV